MYSGTRSRTGSTAKKFNADAPLHDTINTAVKNTDTTSQVPEYLVAQLTEQITNSVINRLKAGGMGVGVGTGAGTASDASGTTSPTNSYQQLPSKPGRSGSPAESTTGADPRQYTPPSPSGRFEPASYRSVSPESAMSETSSHGSTNMPNRKERRRSYPSPPKDEPARPKPARAPATAIFEATVLEKAWQPLFVEGAPTPRLSQFLRGLALHLINDYEPRNSLVVTPGKMSQFFREVEQPDEPYPFPDIFGGLCKNVSISRMYQGLRCEHHFIQRAGDETPTIPALTTHGFSCWMTALIQADPDREFNRLAQAVLHMPISNADAPTERFPKELSRRLFPAENNRVAAQKLYSTISADPAIPLPSSNPIPPPPSQPPPINTAFERERNPYYGTPSTTASAGNSFSTAAGASFPTAGSVGSQDEDFRAPQMPIERERQPYTGREGTGKIYDHEDPYPEHQRHRDLNQAAGTRSSRSNSIAGGPTSAYTSTSGSRPLDVPLPNHQRHHRSSMTGTRPSLNSSNATSSASAGANPNTRSEGSNLNDIPREYYASNMRNTDPRDGLDDAARYASQRQHARRSTLDPSLQAQQQGYDYLRDSYDDRRRYTGNGGASGTDGYGSYPRY